MKDLGTALIGAFVVLAASMLPSCALVSKTVATGGEVPLKTVAPPRIPGTHVIVFALDGVSHDQFMKVVRSGKAPNIAGILGKETEHDDGEFEHGYSTPNVLSMLPSSTVADWSAIFTGAPPAVNGVAGDEWFVRERMRFFDPVPISSVKLGSDLTKAINDGLIGDELKVPTLYQDLGVDSNVSLLWIYRGATLYTTVGPSSYAGFVSGLLAGKLSGDSVEKSVSGELDLDSVQKLVDAIEAHGVPNFQLVYFPGSDAFAHTTPEPLVSQLGYLSLVTDKAVGQVLDEYRKKNALDDTYVVFIADHGQTQTANDDQHMLGADGDDTPFGIVAKTGFRVRRASPTLVDKASGTLGAKDDDTYQAVMAYQGFMAYVYLADRSTCRVTGSQCDWKRPPRFSQDVMPVVRAFDRVNRTGRPIPRLKGTIDLIFTRIPAPPGQPGTPFQIFDGRRLVPIGAYLKAHPRPDLIDLEERMNWLGVGPYGNRAGDIVMLAKSGSLPLNDRYYFAAEHHFTWHGSADQSDSNVPLMLIQVGGSGERMRKIVQANVGRQPTEKDLTPIIRAIFRDQHNIADDEDSAEEHHDKGDQHADH